MPTFVRIAVLIGVIGLAAQWWQQRSADAAFRRAMDDNGFVAVPMPEGAPRDTVLLFVPDNCPREGSQRALAISGQLSDLGIPNVRSSHYGSQAFEPTAEKQAAFKRLDTVMRGEIPIVLVNGMGKANASADEIIAEYHRTRSQ